MRKHLLPAMALGAALAGGSFLGHGADAADAPAVTRTRGTIEKVEGDTIEVATRNGQHVTIHLTGTTRVASVNHAQLSDIKPDSYIGSAAVPTSDGKLRALEVAVFAPSMRGSGDGHYPWDLGSNSTMTNGAVGALTGTTGRTMTVHYNGGERQIVVPEDVPIVALAPSDRSIIKAGEHVVAFSPRTADSTLNADRLLVGENGTVPPM